LVVVASMVTAAPYVGSPSISPGTNSTTTESCANATFRSSICADRAGEAAHCFADHSLYFHAVADSVHAAQPPQLERRVVSRS
jgi:hypothetical protein